MPGRIRSSFGKTTAAGGLAVLLFLAAAGMLQPALAMRCGSRLISEGDTRERLANECGPPANIETWEEERYHYYDSPPPAYLYKEYEGYGSAYRVKIHVKVEVWTYNHGPSRFMDFVRIENGRVRRIYSGGYGY
jgi:hypothetical protein